MKLSILIPTIRERAGMFIKLFNDIQEQASHFGDIEIIYSPSFSDSIGTKRNKLLERAKGKYVAFVDDDDRVSPNYIQLLMEGIEKDVDCCSLIGLYSVNGGKSKMFLHYLACEKYYETSIAYHRYPNHLNCIRASIAKQFKFPETNWGEDTDWATQIKRSGLLKTEHKIEQVIYYYDKTTR